MNTTLQGESYEDKVYAYFSSLLDNDILPFAPKGSLKLPWNPILAKDSTYPIQEDWNISNAM